jgi:chemotaxis protein methyltransferase CheR
MKVDPFPPIRPPELSSLVESINSATGLDLTVYTPATLHLLLSTFIHEQGYETSHTLIRRISQYPDTCEDILEHVDLNDTEMFRDPDLWHRLFSEIIPGRMADRKSLNVWMPSCSLGDDLFSFSILALECGLENQVDIVASSLSRQRIEKARTGRMSNEPPDLSLENYLKAGGKKSLWDYVSRIDRQYMRSKQLVRQVTFREQGLFPGERTGRFDLILYRNRLNLFLPGIQALIVQRLLDQLDPGGFLVIGYGERITDSTVLKRVAASPEYPEILKKTGHE